MKFHKIENKKTFFEGIKHSILVLATLFISQGIFAQQNKQELKELKLSQEYLSEGSDNFKNDKFSAGEAEYRKAISLNPKDETGKYNLGTAYYGKNRNAEAMKRFGQAATTANSKPEKHKAFHNLGNTLMNEKNYQKAVEAYKSALRNNPTDDETRYNLALAKDMLEKNPPQDGGGGDNEKDKNEDKKDQDKENKDQDQKDQKEDEGDKKEDNKEGDKEKDKGKPDEGKDGEKGEKPEQPQQPKQGQLSPQQVKSLLEAMNNEEKKVQDKINAEKQKGAKVKTTKDW